MNVGDIKRKLVLQTFSLFEMRTCKKKKKYIHRNLNIHCRNTQLNVNACLEWEQNVQRGKGQELFQLESVTTVPKSLTGAEPSPWVQYFDRKEIQISSLFSKSLGSHAIYTACGMNAAYSFSTFFPVGHSIEFSGSN